MTEQITYIAIGLAGLTLILFFFIIIYLRRLTNFVKEIIFDIEELYRTTHSDKEVKIIEKPEERESSKIDLEKTYSRQELERIFRNRSREIAEEVEKLKQVEKLLKKWR